MTHKKKTHSETFVSGFAISVKGSQTLIMLRQVLIAACVATAAAFAPVALPTAGPRAVSRTSGEPLPLSAFPLFWQLQERGTNVFIAGC
jgi:hypothetical protein